VDEAHYVHIGQTLLRTGLLNGALRVERRDAKVNITNIERSVSFTGRLAAPYVAESLL
jgi:hypothetical protein